MRSGGFFVYAPFLLIMNLKGTFHILQWFMQQGLTKIYKSKEG